MNAHSFNLSGTPWALITLGGRDGVRCLVDAIDYPWLIENTWNLSWGSRTPWQLYAKRNVGPEHATVRMHREVLIKADPRSERFMGSHHGDHINGQTLDNRRANLRWATNRQNSANRTPRDQIPSIDAIVAGLLAGLEPADIPF